MRLQASGKGVKKIAEPSHKRSNQNKPMPKIDKKKGEGTNNVIPTGKNTAIPMPVPVIEVEETRMD